MAQPLTALWKPIADVLKTHVNPDTFQRWFNAIELAAADEEKLTLRVPNNIFQLWIESNYLPLLNASILSVLGSPRSLRFLIAEEPADNFLLPVPSSPPTHKRQADHTVNNSGDVAPVSASGMNVRYTFESFVVGANNQVPHAAALAVAHSPAKTYNPLFFHGGSGLGKTHLMQAIGQHVAGTRKNGKVLYVTGEQFVNEFIDAIQNHTLVKFRRRYRHADVLLIDDIQFLAGKERSQEEFFHTFNALSDGHRQIVLSSDRPPTEIANLEQRLVSRFEWGLTAELQPPDAETRHAILRKKMQTLQVKLDDSVIEFLAKNIRTNVRRLEGALMRVASFASLSGRELNAEAVEHLLKDILQEEARRVVTIDQIQHKVAELYDVRIADMTSKRRPANIAFPRQVAMFLARELTKASLAEIGEAFGGRDHGTVLHAHRLVRNKIDGDENIRRKIASIESQLSR